MASGTHQSLCKGKNTSTVPWASRRPHLFVAQRVIATLTSKGHDGRWRAAVLEYGDTEVPLWLFEQFLADLTATKYHGEVSLGVA